MSYIAKANREAYSVDESAFATGPRVGFLGAFELAFDEQTRAMSVYGIEHYFMEVEADQIRRIREAGGEPPDDLAYFNRGDLPLGRLGTMPDSALFGQAYVDAARFFVDGGTPEQAARLARYDERVNALREEFPDLELRTTSEMFGLVREQAQQAEQRNRDASTSTLGDIGSFVGALVGTVNPNTDPLNFWTLPIGWGRTVGGRIAVEAGIGGVSETINQLTGVQEERRLLGLDYGFGQAAMQIGTAAVAGGVFQGFNEAIRAGVRGARRRWFTDSPGDPAPGVEIAAPLVARPTTTAPGPDLATGAPLVRPAGAVPVDPLALLREPRTYVDVVRESIGSMNRTRVGSARVAEDFEYTMNELNRWDGPRPFELTPRTDTAINTVARQPRQADITFAEGRSVDDVARQIDPETFRIYDKLADRLATQRRGLEAGRLNEQRLRPSEEELATQVNGLRAKVADLEARIPTVSKRTAGKYQERIAAMQRQVDELQTVQAREDTPQMANMRAELQKTDQSMRDLAPVVSRAYARARQQWQLDRGTRQAVEEMIRKGMRTLPPLVETPRLGGTIGRPLAPEGGSETPAAGIIDQVPPLASRPDIVAERGPDDGTAEVLAKIYADNERVLKDSTEAWQASIGQIIARAEQGEPVRMDGHEITLDLDERIALPMDNADGFREVSIREMLEEVQRDKQMMDAVNSCPLPTVS